MARRCGRAWLSGLAGAAFLPLLASGAAAASFSPALQALIKAAEAEGSLTYLAPVGVAKGEEGAQKLEAGINKEFGTNLRINYSPGPDLTQIGVNLLQEWKANHPASSDFYITPTDMGATLAPTGLFETVDWKALLPDRITDEMIEEDGLLRWETSANGVTYNPEMLPNPPRTLKGYLDPSLKAKIATTPLAVAFDLLASDDLYGRQGALDYVKALSQRVAGFLHCGSMDRIASGEFAALVLDCGGGSARDMMAAGAPMKRTLLTDFPVVSFFYLTVPKNSGHPNAAKLAIAYLYTPAGQATSWDIIGNDTYFFPESRSRAEIESFGIKNPKLVSADWFRRITDDQKIHEDEIAIFRASSK